MLEESKGGVPTALWTDTGCTEGRKDGTNKRQDRYGGTVENRCRLLFELCAALQRVVGQGRLAVRLSPTTIDPRTGRQNQMYFATACSDPDEVYARAVRGMNDFGLAYLLLTEPRHKPYLVLCLCEGVRGR